MHKIPSYLPPWVQEHVDLYLKDPEKAHLWDASLGGGTGMLTTLLLTTTGAKSGEPRMLPLIYQKVGEGYVVIASKGGTPDHPAWYKNLLKTPACHIRVGKEQYDCIARTAEGDEREELWKVMTDAYAPYDDYQVSAGDRVIPVVVLDPK